MLSELQNPAYQHVLINHLPIIGTAMGVLALVVGCLMRQRAALLPGLAVLFVAGVSAWPVYATGEQAYRPIRKIADDAGREWLDVHMERAEKATWVFYVMAGTAAIAGIAPLRWPRCSPLLVVFTLLAALGSMAAGAYIAEAGGRIRHSEFRPDGGVPEPP
jgi:hypothetical protein